MTQSTAATGMRYHAPYMEWAKTRPSAEFDLAGSNILACSIDDLPGAREALSLSGANDNGYAPLIDAIAQRYRVPRSHVVTATGTSGANFLVFAALLEPGDDVLVERPGYDPLPAAARMVGARTIRFERPASSGYALDPERVERAITPRTRLIVLTHPHNPTGAALDQQALAAVGAIAARAGAHVLVDEVYRDVSSAAGPPCASLGDVFITTSSLTKSYGLSSLRSGWAIAAEPVAYRLARARDVVDGTGSILAERMSVVAFAHLNALTQRARGILTRNKAIVDAFLTARRDLEWTPSVGTIVFPQIAGVENVTTFAERLLSERRTAIGPGFFFNAPAHFRLGYGGDSQKLQRGLEQLTAALDAMAAGR
jgi:aspartate/methionine/tyrosine aminotransferase